MERKLKVNDHQIKMELWRREADPNCNNCYGRGFITRFIPASMNVTNRMEKQIIDRCGCRKKKDRRDLVEKINDGDAVLRVGGK